MISTPQRSHTTPLKRTFLYLPEQTQKEELVDDIEEENNEEEEA